MGHFRPVALTGFGDARNSYTWSMTYFRDHVYVGTNRNVMAVGHMRGVTSTTLIKFPVPVPPMPEEREKIMRMLALCQFGQIWRYHLPTKVWQRVYRPPLTQGIGGRLVPLALGFRNMSIFQGRNDPAPAIYTIPVSGSLAVAPIVLRSYDGENFEVLPSPNLGDSNVLGYRGAVPFKGRLFITPTGVRGGNGSIAFNHTVLCTDDPAGGKWAVSNADGLGSHNQGIFDMGVCGNYLYAGTINSRQGCEIWKTDGEGPPPHRWTMVLDRGADRGPLNQAIGCFAEFKGNLYAGTGIIDAGWDRNQNVGPAAAEVLRIYPDDTWDLVMGDPRLSRKGLRVPSSGLAAGFENGFAGYVWRIRAHDGALYAGTIDTAMYMPYVRRNEWPLAMQRLIDPGLLERFLQLRGGCELWRTHDGDNWSPVTRNGFGNRYNWGIRGLLSTPHGLFVGTANPFGPQIAKDGPAGWRYELNPRGGTEVWHGSLDHAGIDPDDGGNGDRLFTDPWSDGEGELPYAELASRIHLVSNPYTAPPEVEEADLERELVYEMFAVLGDLRDPPTQPRDFAMADVEAEQDWQQRDNPARRAAAAPPDLLGLSEDLADELRAYFSGTFRNVGYWRDEGFSPRQACEQLIHELLTFLPAEQTAGPFSLLAIGSGAEALAAFVRRVRPAATVTALENPALHRLAELGSQPRAPMIKSPGHRTEVPGRTYDVVLWVEGPSTGPRAVALHQTWALLRPGGWFVGTDLLGSPHADEAGLFRDTNLTELLRTCEADLLAAGFEGVRLIEATRETWSRFYRHSREFFAAKLLLQQMDQDRYRQILEALPGGKLVVAAYVFLSATRPTGQVVAP